MFTKSKIYLIEYNIRLGDPECQALIARLKSNVLDIFIATEHKKLKNMNIKFENKKVYALFLPVKAILSNIKMVML